ncbi:MAG: SDR family oxidoreductase [Bacteroidota bacterium]
MPRKQIPIVWVTGASRGIGAAIARAFAESGAHVILSGRSLYALRRNAEEIRETGGRATVVRCDVESEKSVHLAFTTISKKIGRVDILVNNAGATYFKPFAKTTVKEYDHLMATNLRGVFLCIKSVLPGMVKRKKGSIINILSVSAITTFKNSSAYAATKAGLLALSRGLRSEVRKAGVRVVDILPGAVETEMWDRDERKKYHEKMMQPEDVAEIVVSIFRQPKRVLTEEIVIRPVEGDI